MFAKCSHCDISVPVPEQREEIVRERIAKGLPLFCSNACRCIYNDRLRELDAMDAHGEGASGYNPLED